VNLDLTPQKIYDQFTNNQLDKNSAIEWLTSLIESNNNLEVRVKSIEILGKIKFLDIKVYKFLEHLLISDSESLVRGTAAKIIAHNFLNEGLEALKWTLEHVISPNYATILINSPQYLYLFSTSDLGKVFKYRVKTRL
jgi:hypothetical protein